MRVPRRLGSTQETRDASLMAGLCCFKHSLSAAELFAMAEAHFRVVAFERLHAADLHVLEGGPREPSTADGPSLAERSRPAKLGECDAFVSHSWQDDADAKWVTLTAWATHFQRLEERTPMLWLGAYCTVCPR